MEDKDKDKENKARNQTESPVDLMQKPEIDADRFSSCLTPLSGPQAVQAHFCSF